MCLGSTGRGIARWLSTSDLQKGNISFFFFFFFFTFFYFQVSLIFLIFFKGRNALSVWFDSDAMPRL